MTRRIVILASWPILIVAALAYVGPVLALIVAFGWWPLVFWIALVIEIWRERQLERHYRRRPSRLLGGVVVRGPWAPRIVNGRIIPPMHDEDGGRRGDA